MMGTMERLDVALARRGLARSRTHAQSLIGRGLVTVDGALQAKASATVAPEAGIAVRATHEYVSRGAYKLLGALDAFARSGLSGPRGRVCLDVGASTGGFTQVLLERGARRVYALDVGHGQLDPGLRADPRVVCLEGVNAREPGHTVPEPCGLAVADVSFISLTLIVPALPPMLAPGADALLMVKPQFEVGRSGLDARGVVRDDGLREQAIDAVADGARRVGLSVRGRQRSPLPGEQGNVEEFLWLTMPSAEARS